MKAYSQYSIHFWPSTILNLKDRQLICWDPRPPVHANGHPIPWTRTSSSCNLSAECSDDDVRFRHNCRLLPGPVASCFFCSSCLLYYCYLKTQTVYWRGYSSVPKPTCKHTPIHARRQQERGLQLSGVLQVGFTPARSLWLHYCYLNVEGRSGASINSILSAVAEAQDTQTSTHTQTHTFT